MSNSPEYLSVVANAFHAKNAWRSAFFAVSAVAVILAVTFVQSVQNTPVVLVPHELAATNGRLTVTTAGEIRGTSNEYTANTALADLGLILNFTPDNVVTQHKRFLNRVTESLYSSSGAQLLAQAELLKKDGITQSFHPDGVEVSSKGDKVYVKGVQIRYRGTQELQRANLEYVLTYKRYRGFFHVSDLSQSTDVAREEKEARNAGAKK